MKRQGIDVAMVMTVIAAILYAFDFFMEIVVLKLPPYRVPWAVSIFGAVMIICCGFMAITVPDVPYGFAMTVAIFNLFTGSGLFLVVIGDFLGPGSGLYHFMNSRPFGN